jgi:quinol monooxygenase YgiN
MPRYGLHGKMVAKPGMGDALASILLRAADALQDDPGCELYVIHRSADEADSVWVSEVWIDKAAHRASLEAPETRAMIEEAMPLIAEITGGTETVPVGGKGLSQH